MKLQSIFLIVMLIIGLFMGCSGNQNRDKNQANKIETISVPDTGFTGVKQIMSNQKVLKEVSYENGIRNGETKTFTREGELYQTFWYENDLRQDSGKWFYTEGQLFRSTPYVNDTIHGTVMQYYRNGSVRARIGYHKGNRTTFLEEFYSNGNRYTDYPEIITTVKDEYNSNGTFIIDLSLSQNDKNVYFYRGDIIDNILDTTAIKQLEVMDSHASLTLEKSGQTTSGTVGVIASILTPFGNRYITTKTINLPYNDLN